MNTLSGRELIEKFVQELKNKISKDPEEIFLSEDDLKFSFSQVISEYPGAHVDVILEYPVEINNKRCYIDIYFKYDNCAYFIELKYITAATYCRRHGIEGLVLKQQGAYIFRLYTIYKDIERMKKVMEDAKDLPVKSFVLVISNDKNLWSSHEGVAKDYYPLPLRLVDSKIFQTKFSSVSDNEKYQGAKRYHPKNVSLDERYPVKWDFFKEINGSEFNYLIIDLNHPGPKGKDLITEDDFTNIKNN